MLLYYFIDIFICFLLFFESQIINKHRLMNNISCSVYILWVNKSFKKISMN